MEQPLGDRKGASSSPFHLQLGCRLGSRQRKTSRKEKNETGDHVDDACCSSQRAGSHPRASSGLLAPQPTTAGISGRWLGTESCGYRRGSSGCSSCHRRDSARLVCNGTCSRKHSRSRISSHICDPGRVHRDPVRQTSK